jgi:hypothetical protein
MRLLCIDPGTTHLVACVFEEAEDGTVTKTWSHMFNVGHDFSAIAKAAKCMGMVAQRLGVRVALIEYQAPMGLQHTCRWNAYVEGGIASCLAMQGFEVKTIHPSTAKRKLGIATGNYATNKRIAFEYASRACQGLQSHHEADCFILGHWYLLYGIEGEEHVSQ